MLRRQDHHLCVSIEDEDEHEVENDEEDAENFFGENLSDIGMIRPTDTQNFGSCTTKNHYDNDYVPFRIQRHILNETECALDNYILRQ